MIRVYAEAGIGNGTFFSTEFEEENKEYRIPKFIKPVVVKGYYIRIWLLNKVYILSTNDGFETMTKDRNNFKFLFGISGENLL